MFKNLMNNYFYGKAGKADLNVEDMPATRPQLFRETLRVRFSALIRLNLMYLVVWLPTIVILAMGGATAMNAMNQMDLGDGTSSLTRYVAEAQDQAQEADASEAVKEAAQMNPGQVLSAQQVVDALYSVLFSTLLWLFPCIAITGPATAGVTYVTRNWARDEHAFIWSDFKDAVKDNWKQALPVSVITGALPLVVFVAWRFYGAQAEASPFFIVPQVLVLMIGIIWSISVTYMYPLMVSYKLRFSELMRNALLIAVARLPMSVGIRLLHCVPCLIAGVVIYFFSPQWGALGLAAYYILIGYTLSRFVTASYTNAIFERFINPRIEGAPVNKGLYLEPDEDEDEDSAEDGEA